MHMKMPDVLVAGWFVVLADRRSLAAVRRTHCDGNMLRQFPHSESVSWREGVDVLYMSAGYHEHGAGVSGPPFGSDAGKGPFGDGHDIGGQVAFVEKALLKPAERAGIAIGLV